MLLKFKVKQELCLTMSGCWVVPLIPAQIVPDAPSLCISLQFELYASNIGEDETRVWMGNLQVGCNASVPN